MGRADNAFFAALIKSLSSFLDNFHTKTIINQLSSDIEMLDRIKQKLEQSLPGSRVEVMDDSPEHLGHNASGAHLTVFVTYSGFKNKSLTEQHQMIYKVLEEEMKHEIHALKIKTKIP